MAFKVNEKYRFNTKQMNTTYEDGNNGVFKIPLSNRSIAYCIVGDGGNWEHVSVHIREKKGKGREVTTTPTWAQMCKIKDHFWGEEDCVVQYHPPKSDYVDNHPNVLHLWRSTESEFNRPPKIFV